MHITLHWCVMLNTFECPKLWRKDFIVAGAIEKHEYYSINGDCIYVGLLYEMLPRGYLPIGVSGHG